MDWRLFLPESWDDDCAVGAEAERIAARRARCAIPAEVGHRPKWQLALDMLDELAAWGHFPPVVAGDAGYGDNTTFRLEPTRRDLPYVLAAKGSVHHRIIGAPLY